MTTLFLEKRLDSKYPLVLKMMELSVVILELCTKQPGDRETVLSRNYLIGMKLL